ncbi:MAG TPA: DUF2378 family protein [Chloroflexia bacterium]|nr:DUF2378 family protein [Chloroflexia bacterium]
MPPSNVPPGITPALRIARPPVPDADKMILLPLDNHVRAAEIYLTPGTQARIAAEFGAYLGKPRYPLLVSNAVTDLVCATDLADRPVGEARALLGAAYLWSYRSTIAGRVTLAALPLMGIARTLRRAPRDFAATTNYGTRWSAELGPRHWRFDFEDELLHPEWIQGLLTCAFTELIRVPGLQIGYTLPAPKHISFDIIWQ